MTNRDVISEGENKTTLVSRNITVLGKRTSVRLEPEMWNALREIARREQCKIHDICSLISLRKNNDTSLTAAIRVFLMLYYRAASTEDGHERAGHGNFKNMITRARVPEDFMVHFKSREKGNRYNRKFTGADPIEHVQGENGAARHGMQAH